MTGRAPKLLTALVFALLAFGAVLILAESVGRGSGDPAQEIAAGLSCPSCAGQSVAESDSPVAVSMRHTIAQQLSQGRTPDQIRNWFVGRYGPDVLRTGSGTGPSALWLVPLVAVAGVTAVALVARRTQLASITGARRPGITVHRRAVFVSVGALATVVVAGVALSGRWIDPPPDAAEPVAASAPGSVAGLVATAEDAESRGDFASAAEAYRSAGQLSEDPAIRLRQAFSLLRAEQPESAIEVADAVVRANPKDPDAMLILGLAQRASGDPAADQTLRRFLALRPTHPAAGEVGRLLGVGG
ncbi:hypothetical protein AU192_19905 [Mycobacterium lehmannii]|uniref:Cytochrome c-type biogenesis protein n=1 Tax=Mycobacterium lehmannii TaxID=2048550 RepID=A0A101A3K1_9MYCO|nr:cytochrome c-type biogenesis protein CcmH [Mycobacterium lehmannii]KUI12335.1 hypothetical protein AU192_19905 [Mycobacterium lehmannii]